MKYVVLPTTGLRGILYMPGDKSISHRAIMLGAIANGTSVFHNCLLSADTWATIAAFREMGVSIQVSDASATVIVQGVGLYGLRCPQNPLDLSNAGTAMRLLSGLLAGQRFNSILTGDRSLCGRPMERVVKPLCAMGANISATGIGYPPLSILGYRDLQAIHYRLPIPSAQVKSSLLLAGLYAEGHTMIEEPQSTRDHTERLLQYFRYPLAIKNGSIQLTGFHPLHPTSFWIPGDLSSAAFFLVAAIITPGSHITIRDVGMNPTRIGMIHILKLMGAKLVIHRPKRWSGPEPYADISACYSVLKGITVPQHAVLSAIDEWPILLVAAACAKTPTLLTGATELRYKESDRIAAMVTGLSVLGVRIKEHQDGVLIEGGGFAMGQQVESCHDHRIAMALAIAGNVAKRAIQIQGCESVQTSLPNFLRLARSMGMQVRVIDEDE